MNELMRRLRVIEAECAPTGKDGKGKGKPTATDEFVRTKKELAMELKEIRSQIAERDELFGKGVKTAQTVALSQTIRNRIKTVREEGERLKDLHSKEVKKKGKQSVEPTLVSKREEQIELVFKHIEEVEGLEKKRYNDKTRDAKKQLFSGASMPIQRTRPAVETDLEDIDVSEGLAELKRIEQDQDNILDDISAGVTELHHLAVDAQNEIRKQDVMLQELERDVDHAKAHLDNINKKMKHTLESIRKGRSFVVDFILLCVLLGLGGFIYNMVK